MARSLAWRSDGRARAATRHLKIEDRGSRIAIRSSILDLRSSNCGLVNRPIPAYNARIPSDSSRRLFVPEASIGDIQQFADSVRANVARVIVGKAAAVDLLLVALLCGGHVLLEDVPGVGKTMLARALATSLGLSFRRLQCTPDLLPNDVLGVSVYRPNEGAFMFQPGPIFANILLADEINRATPRTQSALLEAMGEGQVTVDGVTRTLGQPFLVLATQNPVEFEGTFPLPEAQLDRFLVEVAVGYPTPAEESQMLRALQGAHPIDALGQAVDGARLPELQAAIWGVHVDDTLRDYIIDLANA